MFRTIRKKKNEISIDTAKALVCSPGRGVLQAENGDNGYPYAIPINYVYDDDAQKIYFHGARAGHKVDALRACDKVCFTVYGNETIKEKEDWAPFVQRALWYSADVTS
ncbi:MAG: pyridoxamine 5'-phosphate oxidase family protein [Lawsonibacter sp.]